MDLTWISPIKKSTNLMGMFNFINLNSFSSSTWLIKKGKEVLRSKIEKYEDNRGRDIEGGKAPSNCSILCQRNAISDWIIYTSLYWLAAKA